MEHDTRSPACRRFFLKVRIATERCRNLRVGLDESSPTDSAGRHARSFTQRYDGRVRCICRNRARIGCAREAQRLSAKKLAYVRCTDCALVLTTKTDVGDREEFHAPSISPNAADCIERIVGIATSTRQFETCRTELDRDVNFSEQFLDVILALSCLTGVEADHIAG